MPKGTCKCTPGCMNCWNDCKTFGACVRGKGIRVAYCGQGGGDATAQKRHEREIDAYESARRQGVQPATTKLGDIEKALTVSDKVGAAFDAATGSFKGTSA